MLIAHVLGPTEMVADGSRVDLGGPQPRRLVTALLAAQGRPVGDDALAEAIWGDRSPAGAGVSLQAYVSRLRRALGRHRDALPRTAGGYRLRVDELDAARFTADVERARDLAGTERPAEAVRLLEVALGRWRGEAYAELADTGAATAERVRLGELRSVAVEERLAALLAIGDAPGAAGELESAVRSEPYRERRWQLLILALYRSGRQADALAALRRVRARLAADLGIDPGPALQELESRLLAQDPALLLPAPQRIAMPAPPPATTTPARPLTRFLGRGGELATLATLLAEARLLTVVGPGGAGKTRLAIEFVIGRPPDPGDSAEPGHLAETGDPAETATPVWLVRLADVTDAALVAAAAAAAAGVRAETAPALAAALGNRAGLLVLDNCEHLTAAVAGLVLTLLSHCPGLRVLATSREPLGVDGERLLPLGTLPAADAIALLADRITAVRPGWRPTATDREHLAGIATALDGIPLALELAAARARVLGLGELLEMLDDRFPVLGPVPRGGLAPHQTLEAAIAWSVDLLPAGDRALLLRLWPFEGGFTLAAVDRDLTTLSSLVARSMVVADTTVAPARYRLLGIVRAYCRDRDPDPAGSRARHAAWVRDLVERHMPELRGERSAHAIKVLNRELANLRAGIVHDLAGAPAAALRTAGLLDWFWFRGGHVAEGTRLLSAALAGAPDGPPTDRARAWLALATLSFLAGDIAGAERHLRAGQAAVGPEPAGVGPEPAGVEPEPAAVETEPAAVETEPAGVEGRLLLAQAAYYEALMWRALGDFAAAATAARRSLDLARGIGDDYIGASGTMALGAALVGLGRVAEGRRLLADAAARSAALRHGWPAAMSELLLARALLAPDSPDPDAARATLRQALTHFAHEDDVGNVLVCLHTGAHALVLGGHPAEGATLLEAARRHAARRGLDLDGIDPLGTAAVEAALTAALSEDDRSAARTAAAGLDEAAMPALLG